MPMLNKLRNLVPSSKTRDVLYTAGGMGALLLGRKLLSVGMFTKGALGLEQAWREAHPDFDGDLAARWEEAISFYEQTHADPINRKLHVIGIPMILGGTVGLLVFKPFRPPWFMAATSFTAGWALNIVGHAAFEKNAPAFSNDPLSFIAGPVWDFKYGGNKRPGREKEQRIDAEPKTPDEVISGDPAAHGEVNVKDQAAAA
jgi:hypothetical protein